MVELVKQPTINPTRKLSAAVISVALVEVARVVSRNLWPGLFDEAFWAAISPIAAFAVGYLVHDEANT